MGETQEKLEGDCSDGNTVFLYKTLEKFFFFFLKAGDVANRRNGLQTAFWPAVASETVFICCRRSLLDEGRLQICRHEEEEFRMCRSGKQVTEL